MSPVRVLDAAGFLAVLLLLVVFPSEVRRALLRLDSLLRFRPRPQRLTTLSPACRAISQAAFALAEARLGALIVIARRDSVWDLVDDGMALGAQISSELLRALFQKDSPLHDGAAIIEGDRIVRANVLLPFTQRADAPAFYGTRHRAAMGLAERCDAVVITVSEERGKVTVMRGRAIHRVESVDQLAEVLEKLQARPSVPTRAKLRRLLLSNLRFKLASIGLAGVIWGLSSLVAGTSVRTLSVPVEFSNVPPAMNITEQSAERLQVQLRGNAWLIDSAAPTLVAHFDLSGAQPGQLALRVTGDDLELPPGITMEQVTPRALTVRLDHRRQ